MFIFKAVHFRTSNGEITIDDEYKVLSKRMYKILEKFELKVKNILTDKRFPYVQGILPKNLFEDMTDDILEKNSSKENVFLLTQHPNFVGDKVIRYFIDYSDDFENNFIITFEEPISSIWLNSSVDYMDVIHCFEDLLRKVSIKKNLNITFIRIYDSELLKFEQVNLGASKKIYTLK